MAMGSTFKQEGKFMVITVVWPMVIIETSAILTGMEMRQTWALDSSAVAYELREESRGGQLPVSSP